jgi:hypothetical protein
LAPANGDGEAILVALHRLAFFFLSFGTLAQSSAYWWFIEQLPRPFSSPSRFLTGQTFHGAALTRETNGTATCVLLFYIAYHFLLCVATGS